MIASAGGADFRRAVEILLGAAEFDALLVLAIDVGLAKIADIDAQVQASVAAARKKIGAAKPVLTCFMEENRAPLAVRRRAERLPDYAFPEDAARVLGKMARYAEWRARPDGVIVDFENIRPEETHMICENARRARGAGWLSGDETRKLLAAFTLPVPPGGV